MDWTVRLCPQLTPLLSAVALGFLLGQANAAPSTLSTDEAEPTSLVPPKLLKRVSLEYPEAAASEKLHGNVSLLVTVNATGTITAIEFEHGSAVFREVALAAAQRLEFEPAQSNGVPVTATTRIRFHFAPPKTPTDVPMAEYIIHADSPDLEDTHARTTLDEAELVQSAGQDLATTVTKIPGVTTASGTNASAKPIIRGHHERRLLVLYDGVRHESQKWGPDHATEIDPFAAGSISVIRGAAGTRYGPDAIGGVILVEPPLLRTSPGIGGNARLAYNSNGSRPYGALRLDAVPAFAPKLSTRLEVNFTQGSTLEAPDYLLGNTASSTWNAGTTVGYRLANGTFRLSAHRHSHRAGLFYGVNNSSPEEFESQLNNGAPTTHKLWSKTREIDQPYQAVTHDIVTATFSQSGTAGTVEATYAYQHNHRQEYEQVRGSISGAQYDFTLRTHSLDAVYEQPDIETTWGSFEGSAGLQGTFQENVYLGYALLPNYRAFTGGLFAVERLSRPRLDLELGARYDTMSRATFLSDDDHETHIRVGTLTANACDDTAARKRCDSTFHTGSVSAGGLFHLVPDTLDIKVDLSSASRFPNIDEHFLMGYAPSFPVFGVGSPALGVETAWGGSITAGLRLPWLNSEVSGHGSLVKDYIYFAPAIGSDGQPQYDVTIQGTWPRYHYSPLDARVYGVDGLASFGPDFVVGLDIRGAMVRIQDHDSGEHLVGTPADRANVDLVGRIPAIGVVTSTTVRLQTEVVARQTRTNPDADFAAPPDGYTLFGFAIEWAVDTGPLPLQVGIEVHNLMNTAYRDYTSLLRYYADQPGRDVRLWASTSF